MSQPLVSAIIVNWNGGTMLQEAITSLLAQTWTALEVIVVDNGSTDGSAEFAQSRGARVLRLERNLGFAAAVNRGVDAAQADGAAAVLQRIGNLGQQGGGAPQREGLLRKSQHGAEALHLGQGGVELGQVAVIEAADPVAAGGQWR